MAGERVLVIDDNKDVLEAMKDFLEVGSYTFLGARAGKGGLQKALMEKPDLILLDLVIPDMSAWDFINALREKQCDIPIIIITAYGSEEIAAKAFSFRVKDYIIKPLKGQDVLTTIDRALTERRLEAERERLTQQVLQINKRLESRIKELDVLYAVGKAVTSLLNLEELLNRIVEAAVFVTGAEEGSLMLMDKDTGELYLRAARGLGEKFARGFRLKVEDSIAGQVVKTGQTILQSTQDEEMLKVKTGYLVRSLVNVPLKAKEEVIGVLGVDNKVSSKPFTDNDVYLLSALADYAAIAIENAWLYKDIEDKAAQLDTLLKIAQSITSQLDLEAVLQMIVDSAVTKLGADVATLYLYDPIRDAFPSPVTAGQIYHPEEMIPPTKAKDFVVYRMLRQEGLYLAHDAQHDEVMAGGFTRREKIRSSAGFSLRVGGEPVGAMFVNYRRPHRFTEGEKNIFTLFAQTAAIAIQNAQFAAELEQKVEERTQELRTAYEELQEAQEQMIAAERWAILGKAAANLAHRINNTAGLIPVVAQDLEELLADVALEEERRQEVDADLQRIERNTRFTLQMADALFKPFEELPTEDCDVSALLEESISVADVPKDVALKTKYADELPRVSASRRLADVFVELITNAVKAMPDGGELEIGSRLGGEGWVEVWFSDTGHGIPPESQDRVFDLFFTTLQESLGFGLWWVKTFLEQQGATIDVESEVGKGTTFTVNLPVEGPQAAVG